MKRKVLTWLACLVWATGLQAKETITVNSYTGAGSSINNFYRRIIDQANIDQDRYQFVLVPRPGAQGLIAIQHMDQDPNDRLAMISAGFVDLYLTNKIRRDDYVPINSAGNTCWVVITNKGNIQQGAQSLRGQKEILVGTVAKGSSAHLTALLIGERLGFKADVVLFKSNIDALMLMASDGSINLVIETPDNYINWRDRKTELQGIGINCPVRNPKVPEIRSMKEQGYDVPSIWALIVANRSMPEEKRKNIAKILDQAMLNIGQDQILRQFDYQVPIFHGQTTEQHYQQSLEQVERLRSKFAKALK